jgi:rhodanese-related sulfurtransferase
MKKLNYLLILLLAFTSLSVNSAEHEQSKPAKPAAANEHPYTGKVPKLTRAQLDALLAKPDEIIIIDVRRPDEVSAIGGFPVYLSIQSKEVENSLASIPKDRLIITVSNHAGRAGKSADLLVDKGFKVAGAVGAQDYEAEGGKLTKIIPPPPKDKPSATTAKP